MPRRAHELDDLEREAEVPYEATRLARAAPRARARLAALLLAVAVGLAVLAIASRAWSWLLACVAALLAAWQMRRARLGAVVVAGFGAVLGVLLPLALWGLGFARDPRGLAAGAVALVLGAAMLPDIITLVRDAELQHAYGRWARRR